MKSIHTGEKSNKSQTYMSGSHENTLFFFVAQGSAHAHAQMHTRAL